MDPQSSQRSIRTAGRSARGRPRPAHNQVAKPATRVKQIPGKRVSVRLPSSRISIRRDAESAAWQKVLPLAEAAVRFWNRFLDLREGTGSSGKVLTVAQRERLIAIARAVSWVESKHATDTSAPGNHPDRDPMQCGIDAFWRELTKQLGKGGRYVGGPNAAQLSPDPKNPSNYWGNELADSVPKDPGFPPLAHLGVLENPKAGHDDAKFSPTMSYHWGLLYLIQRCNTEPAVPGGRTYSCGDLNRERLIAGAVEYNGGGHPGGKPGYRTAIVRALALFGGLPTARLRLTRG